MTFYYGADGLTGFHIKSTNAKYNDENLEHDFYYKKTLQGDIIGIIDSNGEEIVKYVYDAWGNHKAYNAKTGDLLDNSSVESYTNTSNMAQFIAIKNPFRYRGYYYDIETGLYYLNSRYYDPEIGRFVNADDIATLNITNTAINGLNLYAYCLNNPVNERDDSGYFLLWLFITAIVVGAVISAGIEIVSQGISSDWKEFNIGQILWSALMGGIGGALTVSGLGVLGMTIAGAGLGIVSSVGSNIIGGSDFTDWHTWANIGLSTGLGALFGYLGGAGSRNAIGLDNAVKKSHQFTKAALSYDKVLTKIANGSYKNLAGAAGARAITSKTLQTIWQSIVKKEIISKTFIGLGISASSNFINVLISKIFH